jgi:hypothetical protein
VSGEPLGCSRRSHQLSEASERIVERRGAVSQHVVAVGGALGEHRAAIGSRSRLQCDERHLIERPAKRLGVVTRAGSERRDITANPFHDAGDGVPRRLNVQQRGTETPSHGKVCVPEAVMRRRWREGRSEVAAAFDDSLAGLTELVRASGTAQRLARHAGQLAVRAAVGSNGESALEDQARASAEEAATTMRAMVRTVVEGSEQAHVSGVAVDRVAIALREGTALVREVGMVAREQAETLGSLDTEMMRAQGSVARSAETARSLANRLDALSSHARRLDAILGRFRSGPPPVVTTAAPLQRRSIAVLRPGVERRMPQTSRSRSES